MLILFKIISLCFVTITPLLTATSTGTDFLQKSLKVKKPARARHPEGEFHSFVLHYVTYLYILSIAVLDRWSSPKGVLVTGRITPDTPNKHKREKSLLTSGKRFDFNVSGRKKVLSKSHDSFFPLFWVFSIFNPDNANKKAPNQTCGNSFRETLASTLQSALLLCAQWRSRDTAAVKVIRSLTFTETNAVFYNYQLNNSEFRLFCRRFISVIKINHVLNN